MSPWVQLHAQTNGKVAPCCMSLVIDGNEVGDLRKNPDLADAWNSDNMKQLRRNMLDGKKSSICTSCYKYESLSKGSERKLYNRDYKDYFNRINETRADGSLPEVNVPVIDIRFSNKCNYKCRICSSEFSSLWYEDEQKLNKAPAKEQGKEVRAASDGAAFWESYKTMLHHAKRIHFAGGEPLFMDEHYDSLDHLITINNNNVILSYNTNFSTLRYKKYDVIEMWSKFKRVEVWASLDGMFEKGDYQRKGQKWEKIEANIREVQQKCPNVLFGINITVSILNVLDIPAFYQYMVEHKLVQPDRMNLYLLFSPDEFNVVNLTPALKEKVKQRFEEFEKNYLSTVPNSNNIRNHIKRVIGNMMSGPGKENNDFRNSISGIDAIRDENFISIYPELREMMDSTK
jgi:MoaA/NifB/PqqE/SkfB family radical SAM enzyme